MRREPLIIGAGPAGAAAAITLCRAGGRPTLVERATGPTHKVCGDFLGVDAIRQARALGVDPASLGAAPIDRLRLIHGERTAETALPFPAFGLSRRAFDAALLRRAEQEGAIVRAGLVRRLTRADRAPCAEVLRRQVPGSNDATASDAPARRLQEWTAQTDARTPFAAETVFLATGKHDLRDCPRAHGGHRAIGMKMYFALRAGPARTLGSAVELTLFPGGYAGMQAVEHGQVVLCIAVQRRAMQQYGGGWAGLIAAIARHSRRFGAMLESARPVLPRPLAVAGIPYGYQAPPVAADSLYRLGDQAAVIPSLTGDGMAIALYSGRLAAESWLGGVGPIAYHKSLARTLAPRMRLGGLLHHACMSAAAQFAVVHATALFPALLRLAARHTRLPSDSTAGSWPGSGS
ncbi:MAG TPA: FAD-dependent monooxygenase [Rhodopila sp.]